MDDQLFEQLLNEEESDVLDVKACQYPFVNANKNEKSELLKDVLAFANAWRRAPAYILLGVREVQGGRSIVVGVTEHLDDAAVQQFVNSKTNRPVAFAYEAFGFEGKQVGALRIALQERPIYLVEDYGVLRKDTVYVRRGSSTDKASIDEIKRMGTASIATTGGTPVLELEFGDGRNRSRLGTIVRVDPVVLQPDFDPSRISDSGTGRHGIASIADACLNTTYFREFWDYYSFYHMMTPVGFVVRNISSCAAYDVRVEVEVSDTGGLALADCSSCPDLPQPYILYAAQRTQAHLSSVSRDVTVTRHGDDWLIGAFVEKVQPKRAVWTEDQFYVGSTQARGLELTARVFADNLPEPQEVKLRIGFDTEMKPLTWKDFLTAIQSEEERH